MSTLKPSLVFADDDYLVIDKPPFWHTVAQKDSQDNTLAQWLTGNYPEQRELGNAHEMGICHRLDFETSGLVLVARNIHAYNHARQLFSENKIEKSYTCLTRLAPQPGIYEAYAGGRYRHSKKVDVSGTPFKRSQKIITEILAVEEDKPGLYLNHVRLVTGTRHQIRAHLAFLGTPIVGDAKYGGFKSERLMLHACHLTFYGPTGIKYDPHLSDPF